jgi:ABC-type transport system involved in multi-copper enzyme maturation permease subunit
MMRSIIEKELREIIGSARFAITFGVCSLLIVLSFYIGAENYRTLVRQHEAAKRENLRQMEGLTDWFAVQQHRIFLPPQPLATLVTGVSNDIGRTIEVRGRGELAADGSRFNEDPIFAVFRFLDLDFIFQIVLSLFAILFAYDAICGEKERGTLKLSFANPVRKETYILGKLFGSYLALALPLLAPILAGCVLLLAMGVPMSADEWARLGLIVAAGLLYFGVYLAVSVFVSSVSRRSSSAFLMLLVIWILTVLVLPRTAVLVAGRAVDVPSVDEVASQKNRYSAQLWADDRKAMAEFRPSADKDNMEQTMSQFNEFMQKIADERDTKLQEFSGRLNEERENRQRGQRQAALGLARVSPSAVFSLAVSSLAGTSLTLERAYKDAAASYQRSYAAFMKEKTGMLVGGRVMMWRTVEDGESKKPEPINPNDLPEFAFQPPSLAAVVGDSVLDLGLLMLFTIVFFFGSYLAFLRYDVR